jgi:beta-glucosidase
MRSFKLPKTLKLGSATSALQIEGEIHYSNWLRWAEHHYIFDGSSCAVGANHYNHLEEDIDLLKSLGHECYRMSVEWSRIEPKEGYFDAKALRHYRKEVALLIQKGIEPMITLHHFSDPIWFEDLGGWQVAKNKRYYLRYIEKVIHVLGDLVPYWITFNEPNVYFQGSCIDGTFPPGEKGIDNYFRGSLLMIETHTLAYRLIHQYYKDNLGLNVKVGVAHHLAYFTLDKKPHWWETVAIKFLNRYFHDLYLEGMTYGNIIAPFHIPKLKKGRYADFIGINYYARHIVRATPHIETLYTMVEPKKGGAYNDLGWEIYPEGLYHFGKKIFDRYGLPILITENGTPDAEDDFRGDYIIDHLYQVYRLINEGVPISHYYHWSFLDNFEWADGLTPRFGLVEVDYQTQKRKVRPSALLYKDIIETRIVRR